MWVAGELEDMKHHILLEATTASAGQFYACGWADKKPKFILLNTNPEQPSICPCHRREVVNGEPVSCIQETWPHIIELFFQHFSAIEVYDHLRQGSLAMEREWYTHSWWHCVFGTILGIRIVHGYMAYRYESEQAFSDPNDVDTFTIFILGHQLVFNEFLDDGQIPRRYSNQGKVINKVTIQFNP